MLRYFLTENTAGPDMPFFVRKALTQDPARFIRAGSSSLNFPAEVYFVCSRKTLTE